MLAGIGFIAAYSSSGSGPSTAVLHSNLALGDLHGRRVPRSSASAPLIWVRHLMPDVELTEQRHPMASTPAEKAAFKETFTEGAEASQFVKRPIMRRTLIAATMPARNRAAVPAARHRPAARHQSLDTTVWRKGLRLIVYGTGRPDQPRPSSTRPAAMISVVPEGYQDDDDAWPRPR